MHCHRVHHSLLHLAEDEIANVIIDLAPAADDIGAQKSSNASSSIRIATVANVQTARTEVSRTFDVLLAIAWADLHTAEGRCIKVRALLNQGSTLSFIFESLCQTLRTAQRRADLQIRCFGEDYIGHARSKIALSLTL
jgi:hypothetical protein